MHHISDYNFIDKRALVRVDFNVPLDKNGNVTDDSRIRAALPTINKILKDGGSCVLMSHLGRPKGVDQALSLVQIVPTLAKLVDQEVLFVNSMVDEEAFHASNNLKSGQILLLENLRFDSREKEGNDIFSEALSNHGDVYVNDAFGTSHRAHSSTTVIAKYFSDKMFGCLLEKEIKNIDKVLFEAEKPMTAIVGGAKVSSKINILENLIYKCEHLIIGGGMAYTFIKAKEGKVGASLIEDDYINKARAILAIAEERKVQFHLPIDSIIADKFSNEANTKLVLSHEIPDGWMGLDIGPQAVEAFSEVIAESKTILWNGPMGVFEMPMFAKGTEQIAKAVAASTQNGCYSLVGGGDSVAAINKFELNDQISYISTGGGAMLEYLEGKKLPGIKAISN